MGRSSLHLGDFLCSFFYYLGTCAYPYSYSYTIFLSNLNLDSLTWDLETYIITNHIFSHFHYYRNTAVHGLYLGWLLSCQVSLCEFYNTVVCIEAVVYSTVVCKVVQRILGYIQFGYKYYIYGLPSHCSDVTTQPKEPESFLIIYAANCHHRHYYWSFFYVLISFAVILYQ